MSHINKCRQSGMTLAETLVSIVLLGLFGTLVVTLIAPIASAPNQVQVKVSTVQSAVQVLYRIQRDLRMSDASGVYACTSSPVTACSAATGTLTATPRLAVLTPLNAAGEIQIDPATSYVAWTGVRVYCLIPNASGGSDLKYSFGQIVGIGPGRAGAQALSLSTVAAAVGAACMPANLTMGATNIESLEIDADPANNSIGIRLRARSTLGGRTNKTSFASESYARN